MLLRFSNIKILLPKVTESGFSLAPTASSTMFGCWGNSLAIAISKKKKWTNKKFITTHPSGTLATALIQVREIMTKGKEIPIISSNQKMKDAITEISKKKLGFVCIKDRNTIMLLTDGDIRIHSNNLYKKKIVKVATKNPTWVADTDTALSAINTMNERSITSLLVTKKKDIKKKIKKLVGVLHMHSVLARGIK